MNAKLIATVLVAGAFAGGLWIGGQGDKTVISDGTRNTSYEGGFRADTVTTGGAAAVYEGGAAHVVKDGESIQAAVNAAQPGVEPQSAQHAAAEPDAFQVAMPGYSQPSAHTALAAGGGGGGSSGFGMQVSRMPREG